MDAKNSTVCPVCGSDNVDCNDGGVDWTHIEYNLTCLDCKTEWWVKYAPLEVVEFEIYEN